jgi:hypothetical protein
VVQLGTLPNTWGAFMLQQVASRDRCFAVEKGGRPVCCRNPTAVKAFLLWGASHQTFSRSRRFDVTIPQAYSVLGLDASSTLDEVRFRFHELIRSNHPDGKPSCEQAWANETTRAIVEACTLLRAQRFPRGTAESHSATASELRNRRQTAAEPQSADLFTDRQAMA